MKVELIRSAPFKALIVVAGIALAFGPGVFDALPFASAFARFQLALIRGVVILGLVGGLFWRELSGMARSMSRTQSTRLAFLASLIATVSEALWLFEAMWCADWGGCGERLDFWLRVGSGALAVAVIAMWIAARRSRNGVVPLVCLAAVAGISFYMLFGPPPS